ncbi:MAG: hypothetical protein OEV66_09050 [Spirochaetia bacterium]|nr:hypothetical protein [Spirochaetia bacterium]
MRRVVPVFFFLLFIASPVFSQYEEKDFRLQPVLGLWFGPIAAVPGTELSTIFNTSLSAGFFARLNIPSDNFLMETGIFYSQLNSDLNAKLLTLPAYMAAVYKLPVDFALSFYFKGGAGMGFFQNQPENHGGFLPVFFGGFETSFPAGKFINIGVRFDYFMIYETWMNPPTNTSNVKMVNGHIFNVGIMANFNTNP